MSQSTLNLTFMGREFRVACEESEKENLRKAADLFSQKMKDVKESGGLVGLDKIAVLAGLNLAHEFLQLEHELGRHSTVVDSRLQDLTDRLDGILGQTGLE
ncbi:MAG: cell division protein ZapA [bacterium]